MTIKEMLAPVRLKGARSGKKRLGFLGVTIHDTANYKKGAGAESHAKYLQGLASYKQVSWHYAADDKLITRSVPELEIAWHAGDGSEGGGNAKTVSIEICVNPESTLYIACNRAAELAADILRRNGHTRATSGKNLFQHHDWISKDCPFEFRRNTPYPWNQFVDLVNWFLERKDYTITIKGNGNKYDADAMTARVKMAGFAAELKY